jgi:hypothetical protein
MLGRLAASHTLIRVLERWMQVVDDLVEAVCLVLMAICVEEVYLNTPFLHRKLWHRRIFGTTQCQAALPSRTRRGEEPIDSGRL